jgi:methionyl-tRNA synthetase
MPHSRKLRAGRFRRKLATKFDMSSQKERVLITSALPYINGVKHLGNLIGSMLPADVYARFKRLSGFDVLFICATDEHGTPAELAAAEAGMDVATYCKTQHVIQAEIYQKFQLSFDHFGRSSSQENAHLTQHFCDRLDRAGLIEERVIQQVYSLDDERFLPDRYIIGTCPHCGYDHARGDQCENCTRVLDPTDLINPRSAISGSTRLEVRSTRHLFLLQSKCESLIRNWIDKHTDWPILVRSIAHKWLDEGLRDRAITRDLTWGVPVNRPGFEGKVFYVWFDAPIEYLAATWEWANGDPAVRNWRSWWYEANDVYYVEFMAKDNIPFHTISFPCTIIGSEEPWKTVDYIKGFNWLTYYGSKFSTSQNRGIFTDKALIEFSADYYRYALLANAPESGDANFTWELFARTINKDLADVLGNFVNRCVRFGSSRFDGRVPAAQAWGDNERELWNTIEDLVNSYGANLDALNFRRAVGELRAIWAAGNDYLTKAAPWSHYRDNKAAAATAIAVAFNLIRLYGILSFPVIPETALKLLSIVGLTQADLRWPSPLRESDLTAIADERSFVDVGLLFEKISEERVAELVSRYGGAPPKG